jgi:uncharacterized RDD family membrane protein YckC
MDWFYAQDGRQLGPVSETDFAELSRTGVISADTLVWHAGMADWQPFRIAVPGLGEPTRLCNSCGNAFPAADLAVFGDSAVCAACKPAYIQRLRQGMVSTSVSSLRYAGFWMRVLAYLIDVVVLEVVYYSILIPLGMAKTSYTPAEITSGMWLIPMVIATLLNVVYYTFFNGRFGASPGKMALGLKIVRPDGSPISYMTAFGRSWAYWLSSIILGFGFFMIGWDSEKRGLHDRVCDTRVIRTR